MTADPLRLMRQYRRPRTRVGRAWDRTRRWVREQFVPCAWLVGTLTIPATAVMIQAGAAHADPTDNYITVYGTTVCAMLDRNTSLAGVAAVGNAIVADGFGPQVGRILVDSVAVFCPRHTDLLEQFVAVYGDNTTGLVLR